MERISFEDELERKGVIVYRNKGMSMMPLLRQDRDLMVIEKRGDKKIKKYDAVLYKKGGTYILHRVLKVKKDGYVICGDHMRKKEYDVKDEDIIGVLTEVVRDGKKSVKATDMKYRLYVHLWCDLFHIRAALLYSKEKIYKIKKRIAK